MNFVWRISSESDYKEFNNWHTYLNNKFGEENNAYTKYLTAKGCLIGDLLQIICVDSKNTCCYTALLNGNPVGFSMISVNGEKQNVVADVEVLGVSPMLQSKGVGTAMVFDIVKDTKTIIKQPISKITAKIHKTNVPSQKVFEKNEFKQSTSKPQNNSDYNNYEIKM